ncbi:mucin-5AC-like [Ylistrum balloti]|uniref:mucin-5AC-like n=1 Tax=Ylistrum balloti TaxID=509963 RepID=UPI0029058570|nr:mucin-5AC-like [Ylistrum balloti]
MTPNNVKKETAWGGVVYAYNDRFVRVWVPGFDTGRMFSVADGWGRGSQETWSEGMVKVRVWGNMPGDSVYKSTATIGQITTGNLTSQLHSVSRSLDMDTGLISVTLKALNGNNNGYSFPTLGAVQNTDPRDKFGGVVYSYSPNAIRIWHPIVPGGGNTALYTKGSIIYLSPYWGGGSFSQDSKNGLVEVRFWNSYTGQCPPPTTPAKASTSPFTGTTSNMSRPHSTPLTTRTTSRLTTSFLPITSVPVLTSTTARSATVTSTSTKSTASTSRTSFHAQSSRHVSTAIPSTRTSSGGHSGANSKTVSRSVGTTTGFRGSKATTSSTILTGTGGTNSQATRSTLRDGQDGQDDGGLSPVATGLIATASILSAACCLSGLIFGLLKKMKRKQKVDPEIENNDAFGSQKAIEDKGNPATNNGTSPTDDGTHPSSTTDNGNPSPENGSPPTGNGSPPVDTGSPQIATDRPQTARPE